MYRTITRKAILHNVEINGKIETCLWKILCNLYTDEEANAILTKEKEATGNENLFLGISEWEEWV